MLYDGPVEFFNWFAVTCPGRYSSRVHWGHIFRDLASCEEHCSRYPCPCFLTFGSFSRCFHTWCQVFKPLPHCSLAYVDACFCQPYEYSTTSGCFQFLQTIANSVNQYPLCRPFYAIGLDVFEQIILLVYLCA